MKHPKDKPEYWALEFLGKHALSNRLHYVLSEWIPDRNFLENVVPPHELSAMVNAISYFTFCQHKVRRFVEKAKLANLHEVENMSREEFRQFELRLMELFISHFHEEAEAMHIETNSYCRQRAKAL